jgi:hypothetical protein
MHNANEYQSTTRTSERTGTNRLYTSIASPFNSLMHPREERVPIDSGSFVPWIAKPVLPLALPSSPSSAIHLEPNG